eukprot:CAMPEP_0170748490 /NCGR_PEP_ID=MMETSP0437-20130122/9889_1 /TAXON_ID=0 /ORGANISM="Sexangularia sp." /LENGTH=203 /DNA_ID=CAMNT_0011087349 /DNA_START=1 /DNA_END=612 /DNA_ORIENTATION=+
MADCIFALRGKSFVILAADSSYSGGSAVVKVPDGVDKIPVIQRGTVAAACSGQWVDWTTLSEVITANVKLYSLRMGHLLSTSEIAAFTRKSIADALRTRGATTTNMLIGGLDKGKASLYFVDYIGAKQEMQFAAHGYASMFLLGYLDSVWTPEITKEEALKVTASCIEILKARFGLRLAEFVVKCIDDEGISTVSDGFTKRAQ